MDKEKNKKIIDLLLDACCQLDHRNPFELLVAVILSAQCTDKRVNEITPKLFAQYNTPKQFIELGENDLAQIIKPCGLYKNKSKNIIKTCMQLVNIHKGNVPKTLSELLALPGVGRKTASVVLSTAFGIPAMPVDTHVFRVSTRIGLVIANNVKRTEQQLMETIPKDDWIKTHHLLIFHGRQVCHSKNPECNNCKIKDYCIFTNGIFK